MDLMAIQPRQVSRDMRGYSVLVYGDPKTGKTTLASNFPSHLILGFEKGYAAIPGAMVQPINTWGEMKKALKELKKQEVKEKFETICVDTADIAWMYCEKYICANAKRPDGGFGVDSIKDIPFGQGFNMVENEFDAVMREIVQLGYGLVIISHAVDKTLTDPNGVEYSKILPTLPNKARNACSRLCDIIIYARPYEKEDGDTGIKGYLRGTTRFMAGSRFKYIASSIEFSYANLVQAINDAIDKEMKERGADFFTDKRENLHQAIVELDFDELIGEFNSTIKNLIGKDEVKFQEFFAPRITHIVEKYLGKGQKITNASRDQIEAVELILSDLKDLIGQ